jgi:hypothetical protein
MISEEHRMSLGKSAAAVAVVAALVCACTSRGAAPTNPSTLPPGVLGAGADGSTLKTTAPTPTAPINAVRIPQGQQVVLAITNSTFPYGGTLPLSYRFEVQSAGGFVVESQLVAGGQSSTARTVAAPLTGDQVYTWRARAEYQGFSGPWSALQSFVAPLNEGYNRPGALYDPLTSGKTVGRIGGSGNVTWIPGQGIRMNDVFAYVVYELPQLYSSGEMSVEVTGLYPAGEPGKARIFSMLDRLNAMASASKYSFNVQYRGAGGAPDDTITWKAVLGDNANSVEAANRFANIFRLDPSKVYLWQGFWTPTSFRLVVKEGGATGPVLYDEKVNATSGTTNWNPEAMFAFLGTNNGLFLDNDGTRVGMTLRNLWVGSTPRPTTF